MREKLKNLLIVLLGILMVVMLVINLSLGLEESNLRAIGHRLGFRTDRGSTAIAVSEPAVLPAKLAIRGPQGLYLAGGSEMEDLLGTVSPILSEALGSVGKISSIAENEFLNYLGGDHIACAFTFPVPFYLLQHWWTGETGFSSDQAASMLAVVSKEEAVAIVFCDDSTGKHYLAETAAGYERFVGQCQAAPAGNAFYAFERDGYHMLAAHEPVWSSAVYYPTYTVAVPDFSAEGAISDQLLSAFDINPFLAEVYKESDGDIVYIEGYNALQFSKDGRIHYSVTGDGGIDLEMDGLLSDKERKAHAARRICDILEQIGAAAGCDGGFSVAGIAEQPDGWVITCERFLGGAFVTETDGYSAVVTVRGGRITGIRITLTTAAEESSARLLPIQLATALLDGSDNSFFVRYAASDGMYIPDLYSTKGGARNGME